MPGSPGSARWNQSTSSGRRRGSALLEELAVTVESSTKTLEDLTGRRAEAERTAADKRRRAGMLAKLSAPPGLEELAQHLAEASAQLEAARSEQQMAAGRLEKAEAAFVALPARGILERWRERRAELSELEQLLEKAALVLEEAETEAVATATSAEKASAACSRRPSGHMPPLISAPGLPSARSARFAIAASTSSPTSRHPPSWSRRSERETRPPTGRGGRGSPTPPPRRRTGRSTSARSRWPAS